MEKIIEELGKRFTQMVANANANEFWKNIGLGREAFEMMRKLPEQVPGEFETPEEKGNLLCNMLEQMDEILTPRLCISVRNEIARLNPADEDNIAERAKLLDYINPKVSMKEFCKKYNRHLLFDPVERTERHEEVIQDVEAECDKCLGNVPRGMGFCFAYWSKRRDILASYGIRWRSPSEMNPGVLFD